MTWNHGTYYAYREFHCRCELCVAANEKQSARALERHEDRVQLLRSGNAPADLKHGRASTYSNWGCRCDPCSEAQSTKNANDHARRQQQVAARAAKKQREAEAETGRQTSE